MPKPRNAKHELDRIRRHLTIPGRLEKTSLLTSSSVTNWSGLPPTNVLPSLEQCPPIKSTALNFPTAIKCEGSSGKNPSGPSTTGEVLPLGEELIALMMSSENDNGSIQDQNIANPLLTDGGITEARHNFIA